MQTPIPRRAVVGKSFALSALVAGMMLGLPALGAAAQIPVPNHSFEEPDVVDDGSEADFSNISGWDGTTDFGNFIFDSIDAEFANTSNNDQPLPSPAAGDQAAGMNREAPITSTDPVATVEDNTTYTLTVALGDRDNKLEGPMTIALDVNGTEAAATSTNGDAVPLGEFKDFSTSFTTFQTNDSLVGGDLKIRMTAPIENDSQGIFDNVRLESSVIPEPSAALLLAPAGLLALRRGRRRS